ncbi:WG repeat-containing protein, partial [Campylobacter coli]
GGHFSEGLAGVKLNGKYGLIDKSGKIVIEPIFDDIDY